MTPILHTKLATVQELSLDLGSRVKHARQSKHMQQSELAARAGISRKTLVALENHGEASLATLLRVLSILGQANQLNSLFLVKPSSIAEMEQKAALPQSISRKSALTKKVLG